MHQNNLRNLPLRARRRLPNRARITFNEDNYQRQYYFTFPYPVTRYIFKNANAKTQLKLRKTCKFFHKMNPMVIVKNLFFGRERPPNVGKYDLYVQNFDEMPMIDVVTHEIWFDSYDKRIISKIHRCEAKDIVFPECELSMEEFNFFTQSGMVEFFISGKIRHVNGKLISLEDLLYHLPNAEYVTADVQCVTYEDSAKIASSNNIIEVLYLYFRGPINIDQLYELLKKVLAPNAELNIHFIEGLTNETYVAPFKAEMEAKINTWDPQDEKPFLYIS